MPRGNDRPHLHEDVRATRLHQATVVRRKIAGIKQREFCTGHAKARMADLATKKCAHPGGSTYPPFGVAGTKPREFCAGHAKAGMIDLASKK